MCYAKTLKRWVKKMMNAPGVSSREVTVYAVCSAPIEYTDPLSGESFDIGDCDFDGEVSAILEDDMQLWTCPVCETETYETYRGELAR